MHAIYDWVADDSGWNQLILAIGLRPKRQRQHRNYQRLHQYLQKPSISNEMDRVIVTPCVTPSMISGALPWFFTMFARVCNDCHIPLVSSPLDQPRPYFDDTEVTTPWIACVPKCPVAGPV